MSEAILKALDSVEAKLLAMSTKADGEAVTVGKISADTKTALDAIGIQQRELADRLLSVEQKATAQPESKEVSSWGEQFIKNARYADFAGGNLQKLRVEVKNTLTGSDTNVAPPAQRRYRRWRSPAVQHGSSVAKHHDLQQRD